MSVHTEAQRKLGSSKPECRFSPQSHMCAFMDAFVFLGLVFFFHEEALTRVRLRTVPICWSAAPVWECYPCGVLTVVAVVSLQRLIL